MVVGDAVKPYYSDDHVTLWHGDCREITEWLEADALVTDPPYGIGYSHGSRRTFMGNRVRFSRQVGIAGDHDLDIRDAALAAWGDRVAICFGSFDRPPPEQRTFTLVFHKPPGAGSTGGRAGFRRDVEAVFLCGPWPVCYQGRSSVIETGNRVHAGVANSLVARYGHPHAKPVDVMETLIAACPPGTIADPFAGSGSTLVAAKLQGRKAIGVEIEERYAEIAARRLSQGVLNIEEAL